MNVEQAIKRPFVNWRKNLKTYLILSILILPTILLKLLVNLLDLFSQFLPSYTSLSLFTGTIGILYLLLALLISFLTKGYLYRATKMILRDDYEMPTLSNIGDLLKKGIRLTLVMFVYALIFVLFFILSAIIVYISYTINKILFIVSIVFALPLYLLLLVCFWYISPMITMHVIAYDRFSRGFDLRRILGYAFTHEYFLSFIISLAVGIAGGAVSLIITLILVLTIVGWILWSSVAGILLQIIIYTIYMQVYKDLLNKAKLPS